MSQRNLSKDWLCISVKLKNLKANHNGLVRAIYDVWVVYIRKVKKSESKSQQFFTNGAVDSGLCISVKLKNLKANHNVLCRSPVVAVVVYIP